MPVDIRRAKVGTLLSVGIIAIIGLIISATIYTNYLTSNAQNVIRKSTLRMFDVFTIQRETDDLFSNLESLDLIIEIEDLERSDESVESKIKRSRQTVEISKEEDVFSSHELERIEDLVDDAETTADEIIRLKRKIIEGGLEYDEFGLSLRTEDTKDLKDQFEIVRYLQLEVKEVVSGVVGRSETEFRQAMKVVERALILTWVVIGLSLILASSLGYFVVKSAKQIYDMKNEFVNIIAHDLRNPITAIVGYLDLASDDLDKAPATLRENIKIIDISVQKLKIQINNLLEVGRSDAGHIKINLGSVNAGEVIIASVERAKALAEISEVVLTLEKDADKSVNILADQNKLSDVLDNLISNAIKYNKKKGTVTVSTKDVGDVFSVSVSDTGKGISKDQKQFVFKKYSRVDSEKNRAISGTGLGLYTVKLSMDQMKGTVEFETKENVGTTFTATFKKADKNFRKNTIKSIGDKNKESSDIKQS